MGTWGVVPGSLRRLPFLNIRPLPRAQHIVKVQTTVDPGNSTHPFAYPRHKKRKKNVSKNEGPLLIEQEEDEDVKKKKYRREGTGVGCALVVYHHRFVKLQIRKACSKYISLTIYTITRFRVGKRIVLKN